MAKIEKEIIEEVTAEEVVNYSEEDLKEITIKFNPDRYEGIYTGPTETKILQKDLQYWVAWDKV